MSKKNFDKFIINLESEPSFNDVLVALEVCKNNVSQKAKSLPELQKLLQDKFSDTNLHIGRGGRHIWIATKELKEEYDKKGDMCPRSMMIEQENDND